ncbi:MAG: PIN domain-containing protein [Bryobacteraceae bacterium]|jgi:predicted nucleic acid-binding protein
MSVRVLIDTNVLVYLYDESEPGKQRQARLVLRAVAEAGVGLVSTQVLSEFFSVVTRRLRPRLPHEIALAELEHHVRVWDILLVTPPVVIAAARAVRDHSLSFWDAQLWAVAQLNQLDTILSEDFQAGSRLGGVRFVNPFAAGFEQSSWLA